MEQKEDCTESTAPAKPGSLMTEETDAVFASTSLPAQDPVKIVSDSFLAMAIGAGARPKGRTLKHPASEPSFSKQQLKGKNTNKETLDGKKATKESRRKGESEDETEKNKPKLDVIPGRDFATSDELPDELVDTLLGIQGVSCCGIGVQCKQRPLVIYCSPTFKDDAMEAFQTLHDEYEQPFMVIIWQKLFIRGANYTKLTGTDTIGLQSSEYTSALGLPVTVDDRDALLGTFHCLVGQLLYCLPEVKDPEATDKQIEKALEPFKDSMNNSGGLKELLQTRKEDAGAIMRTPTDAGVTSSKYRKAEEQHRVYEMILGSEVLDLSPNNLMLHIKCPASTSFRAWGGLDSNYVYKAALGIEARGGVAKRDIGEVSVHFTNSKDTIFDVSHPESSSESLEMIESMTDLEPLSSTVWKRGPETKETTGTIVYTNMAGRVSTLHMRDFVLRSTVFVKDSEQSRAFCEEGDASSVVYVTNNLKKEMPKLLGAISAVIASCECKTECACMVWTYDDDREEGYALPEKVYREKLNVSGTVDGLRPTKSVTLVVPFYNQFQAVKDVMGNKTKISLNSCKPGFYLK